MTGAKGNSNNVVDETTRSTEATANGVMNQIDPCVVHSKTGDENTESEEANGYCAFIVKHSKRSFGITLAAHLFMILITVILVASGYDLLPIDFEAVPLNLQSDSTKLRTDAWWFVKDNDNVANLNGQQALRSVKYQGLSLIYASEGGNVFTKENLLSIQKNEEELLNNTEFKTKLCETIRVENINTSICKPALSIIRFFDGSYKNINPVLFDPNFDNIPKVLYTAESMNFTRAILNYHLGKESVITEKEATSQYTRTLVYTGWPFKGYMNTEDKKDDQMKEINEVTVNLFATSLEDKNKDGVGSMDFYYNNPALSSDAIQKQVVLDMMLAVASLVFIFIFMWLQTGSFWLTAWGIFSVLSSFNISNLIYRVIFDYRYFGIFHVLSIFIILGIGSDNVFVFMDTWKQSSKETFKDLTARLSTVYRHAAKATLITSFTTMMAFLSNVQSPLLAISSFGLFSAILVIVNYLSVILFYPTVMLVHHKLRRGRCCCAPMCCKRTHSADINDSQETTRKKSVLEYIIYFFDGPFFKYVISHKIVRWLVILFFLVLLGVMVAFAVTIEPDTEQIQPWKSDTNWAKAQDLARSAFRPSPEDQVVIVHIIWGLNEQDRSECHHTDYKCKGKTVFDRSFDPNPPPCQIAMLDLCKELKNLPAAKEEELKLRRSQVTGEVEIDCVFERMNEYLTVEATKPKYPAGTNFSFPINGDKMNVLREYNNKTFVGDLPDMYYRFFEIGLAYFITDGNKETFASDYDFKKYVDYFGGEGDSDSQDQSTVNSIQGQNYGHRILYSAIAVNLTLKPSSLGYENGLPIYKNWENFITNKMSSLPPSFTSCNNAFQTTASFYNVWHWLKVQEILVNNAILGIVIGLVLALIVLTLATTNIIVGFLATVTIAMVTASVLGMIPILGWKLGLFESLNLTLIVGLAVDYVVHLAEGYMVLDDSDRLTRVRYTLGHVGVSVFSGACTTIGASIFMLAAKIVFFAQFGIFIFCTIGFSILYSMFFFTAIMTILGPEGDTGSLRPFARRLKDLIRGKHKRDVDCIKCHGKGFHKAQLSEVIGLDNMAAAGKDELS